MILYCHCHVSLCCLGFRYKLLEVLSVNRYLYCSFITVELHKLKTIKSFLFFSYIPLCVCMLHFRLAKITFEEIFSLERILIFILLRVIPYCRLERLTIHSPLNMEKKLRTETHTGFAYTHEHQV